MRRSLDFGTLTQFMGLRKIHTIGQKQANKVKHLSPIAYNLKKYLKFEQKRSNSGLGKLSFKAFVESVVQNLFLVFLGHRKFTVQY
ncbi:transposase [Maribacter luteus]|uniref:Transposase n=1 Tax=Maribacter luteus TaxID=2594478 RepID=A0A6I2MQF9_9FLAO|nr:transposase [Maribacter luteus]MRX64765.1 transposase [Maribacter luteus]